MADYYTNISFAFAATDEQAAAIEAAFDLGGVNYTSFEEGFDLPAELEPFLTKDELKEMMEGDDEVNFGDVEVSGENGKVWIHGSNPYLERVALLIQAVMKPEKPIGFEWSNDCSKHKLDAFGGGCCVIFKDRIEFESTATRMRALMDA